MPTFLAAYGLAIVILQRAFLVAALVLALVCLLDWLVRTRRINPFSAVARFMRRSIDPLFAPIERRVLQSGGVPGNVPWWALAAVVIAGIALLSLLQFIGGELVALGMAFQAGPRGVLVFVVGAVLGLLQLAIMVRVIVSWIPNLSPYSPWVRWAFVLSEPILAPLRRVIPPLGMVDITPIVAYLLLSWVVAPVLMRAVRG